MSDKHVGDDSPGAELDRLVIAEDWDGVVAMLDTRWGDVLSVDPSSVRRAVNALPESVLVAHPRWSLAANYINRFATNGESRTTIFRGTSPTPEPLSLLDVLAKLTSKVAERRAGGRYTEAAAAAAEARLLVDDADDDTRETLRQALPEIVFQWAMAFEYAGDIDRATREYGESHDAAVAIGHLMAVSSAAGALAWIHSLAGRNIQARSWLERLPPIDEQWWATRASVTARFARVLLLADELRMTEAQIELKKISLKGVTERWPAQKYLAALVESDPARCLDLLTQIDSSAAGLPPEATSSGAWAPFTAIARAVLLNRLGSWATSRNALDSVDIDGNDTEMGALQVRMLRATTLLADGEIAQARRDTTALVPVSTSIPRVLIGALATIAAAAHRQGDTEIAVVNSSMALDLARQHQLYLSLTAIPSSDLAAILAAADFPLSDEVHTALLAESSHPRVDPFLELTARELAVAQALIGSATIEGVAADLFVSRNTVKSQLKTVYRKLGVKSRSGLEQLAMEHGYTRTGS